MMLAYQQKKVNCIIRLLLYRMISIQPYYRAKMVSKKLMRDQAVLRRWNLVRIFMKREVSHTHGGGGETHCFRGTDREMTPYWTKSFWSDQLISSSGGCKNFRYEKKIASGL